ncbi:protein STRICTOSIDINE SYNTHASE-LIKE 12-like [Coffea eugenioides]|uniref:protein STRICTOSIDINE SYNTHASE-LIKE 12-like n=1 Tax=Coffea eugenioides TaxID=49369 RepID=UPI000F60BAEC|nr:protein STRICTOSIDINE SYNTHASE-LIKE 12-like [Coffea eugenioides]
MADTFFGLAVVGPNGGKATIIATSVNGVQFNFLNGCDVNPISREVVFTDAGQTFDISHDGSFVLFSETTNNRLLKYRLKEKTTEVFLNLTTQPLKIKRAPTFGEFWLAANDIVLQPRSLKPFGYKFKLFGQLLLTKNLQLQYNNTQVNVLQEYPVNGGTLSIGSRDASYVGIFRKW